MITNLLGFLVREARQGGSFSGNPNLLDEVYQIFAVEIEFFSERVNACGHGRKSCQFNLEPAERMI